MSFTEQNPRLCPHCEAENPSNAFFCTRCGKRLNFSKTLSVQPLQPESESEEKLIRKRTKFSLIGAILVCVVVIFVQSLFVIKGVVHDGKHFPWDEDTVKIVSEGPKMLVTEAPQAEQKEKPMADNYRDGRTKVDHRLRDFFEGFCKAHNEGDEEYTIRPYTTKRFFLKTKKDDLWFNNEGHGTLSISNVMVLMCEGDTACARVVLDDVSHGNHRYNLRLIKWEGKWYINEMLP